jgi:hypothetical protein
MEVLIRAGVNEWTQRFIGWQGEVAGISGQFLVIHLTHDPRGNTVAPGTTLMYEPLELDSPVDWAKYRAMRRSR